MFIRLPAALLRAFFVVVLIAMPSLLLADGAGDQVQVVALIAIFAALFTIVEYTSKSPSLVEFRDAPPFNRLRFSALFVTVLVLTIIFRGYETPSAMSSMFQQAGRQIGEAVDFPYSPVRLVVVMMPRNTDPELLTALRDAAGLSYLVSWASIIWLIILLRLQRWPRRGGAFNVWVNLPTFDPTVGGDVVKRLNRDGRVNIMLGFLLPFIIPAVVKLTAMLGTTVSLDDPQTLIWAVAAWAFLPASILMRGVALTRVAAMIYLQRKRAYEKAEQDGSQYI